MKYLLIALLLSGCATPFTAVQQETTVLLTLEINDNLGKDKHGRDIVGTHAIKNGIHVIKVPSIRDLDDWHSFCVIGHEVIHAFFGKFHDDENADTCMK